MVTPAVSDVSRLTLGYLSLPDVAAADLIEVAAKGGFRSVGLRVTGRYLTDDFPPIVGNKAALSDLKRRLGDSGVRLSNISAYYMRGDVTISDLLPVIEATAELGCDMIVANRHDSDDARYFDNLAQYCEQAGRLGIRLAVECMPYSEVKSLQQARDILVRANKPNLGLLLDPLHLTRCGHSFSEIAGIDPRTIAFAQLCDAPLKRPDDVVTEARTGRILPGEGELPLFDFVNALPDDLELECECPCAALANLPAAVRSRRIFEAAVHFLEKNRRGKTLPR